MPAQLARNVITSNQRYVCLSCRLRNSSLVGARTTRNQHTGLPEHHEDKTKEKSVTKDAENDAESPLPSRIGNIIRTFMFKSDANPTVTKGGSKNESVEEHKAQLAAQSSQAPPNFESIPSIALQPKDGANVSQRNLQQKFATQRRKDLLAKQAIRASKAPEENTELPITLSLSKSAKPSPKKSSTRAERVERRRRPNRADDKKVTKRSEQAQVKPVEAALREDAAFTTSSNSQTAEEVSRDTSATAGPSPEAQIVDVEEASGNDSKRTVQGEQTTTAQKLNDIMKDFWDPEEQTETKLPKKTAKVARKAKALSKDTRQKKAVVAAFNELKKGGDRQDARHRTAVSVIRNYTSKLLAHLRANPKKTSEPLHQLEMLYNSCLGDDPLVRKIPFNSPASRESMLSSTQNPSTSDTKQIPTSDSNTSGKEPVASDFITLQDALRQSPGKTKRADLDSSPIVPGENVKKAKPSRGSALGKAKSPKASSKLSIEKATASDLEIFPVEVDRAPVPTLAYGLERVLFNQGVYQLQDPRSRVYNFDPYLQKIMPVAEFDFNALQEYITSSRDQSLIKIAKAHGKRYMGSTSSMTEVLAHFHFLLSQWRPINTNMLSKAFPATLTSFTELQRTPVAIILRWKDGSYAIDADKQFASTNILSMLGQSMEKMLTMRTHDFERYRKSDPGQVTEDEQSAPQSYHYSTLGDFLMRSQLDAHDSRLPGTGMFDLKTRSVVSIRMDVANYEHGVGYEIKSRQGEWESYEREFHDMIRSAFLKYSLQVRMGRMDGIFVAFHNIERIFGFQYISLAEMDSTLHGQWDTAIGDQEFRLSLALMNKVLDRATQKYPETSIRIHFETRDTQTPFMYIFAEPVTEEQVEEIQSHNTAKIHEFERDILGLVRGKGSSKVNIREDDSKWENIRADVQEAMDKDELSMDESGQNEEANNEDLEGIGSAPDRQTVVEQDPMYNRKTPVDAHDELIILPSGSEGDDCDSGLDEVDREEERRKEDEVVKGPDTDEVTEPLNTKDDTRSSPEAQPSDAVNKDGQQEYQTQADQPFLDSIDQEAAKADIDAESSSEDILAMTLTLRNKVNGEDVLRPENMTAADEWSVEYSLVEVPVPSRARALYKACQSRRSKKMEPEDSDVVSGYVQKLRNLSANGRAWRKEQDQRDEKEPVQVL